MLSDSKHLGLEIDQVRRMKQLQKENLRLKQLAAELALDKAMQSSGIQTAGQAKLSGAEVGARLGVEGRSRLVAALQFHTIRVAVAAGNCYGCFERPAIIQVRHACDYQYR